METLYDDRVKAVEQNTGKVLNMAKFKVGQRVVETIPAIYGGRGEKGTVEWCEDDPSEKKPMARVRYDSGATLLVPLKYLRLADSRSANAACNAYAVDKKGRPIKSGMMLKDDDGDKFYVERVLRGNVVEDEWGNQHLETNRWAEIVPNSTRSRNDVLGRYKPGVRVDVELRTRPIVGKVIQYGGRPEVEYSPTMRTRFTGTLIKQNGNKWDIKSDSGEVYKSVSEADFGLSYNSLRSRNAVVQKALNAVARNIRPYIGDRVTKDYWEDIGTVEEMAEGGPSNVKSWIVRWDHGGRTIEKVGDLKVVQKALNATGDGRDYYVVDEFGNAADGSKTPLPFDRASELFLKLTGSKSGNGKWGIIRRGEPASRARDWYGNIVSWNAVARNAEASPALRKAYDDWKKAKSKFDKWWNPDRRLSERPPAGAEANRYVIAFSNLFLKETGRRPPNGYGNMTLEQMLAANAQTSILRETAVNGSDDAILRLCKPSNIIQRGKTENLHEVRYGGGYIYPVVSRDGVLAKVYGSLSEANRRTLNADRKTARNGAGYVDASTVVIRPGDAVVFKTGYRSHSNDDDWLERNGDTVREVRGDEVKIGPSANDWAKIKDLMVWHNASRSRNAVVAKALNARWRVIYKNLSGPLYPYGKETYSTRAEAEKRV